MQEVIDVLKFFYTNHYNFGIIAAFIFLVGLYLASRKNTKGVLITLCILIAYNYAMYSKTKRDPEWYDKAEKEVKAYDPVKKLWEEKSADDDPNKRDKKRK